MLKIKLFFKNNIFIFFLSFILVFCAYLPLLNADFLSLDDKSGVVDNLSIRNFKESLSSLYISSISSSFIYKLFGLSPVAFHLRGIIIHAFNAYLLYLIAKDLIGKKTALLSLILFTLHPGVSEPVSWISGHIYLFLAFFNLLCFLFFIKFKKEKKKIYLVFSIIFYILLIITIRSPWCVITPIIIFLLDVLFFHNKFIFDLKFFYLIPLIFYLIILLPKQLSQRSGELNTYLADTRPTSRFVSVSKNIERSFSLLILPIDLNITFSYFEPSFLNYLLIILNYIILLLLIYFSYKKDRIIFALLCLIYAAILPLFSPIDIAVNQAERYYYLAIAFYCVLLSYIFINILKKRVGNIYIYIFIFLCFLFLIRTFIRTFDWKNDEKLWRTAENSISNNYNVYNEMGNVYFAKNDLNLAMQYYQKALALRPNYPTAIHNIGLIYLKSGKISESKKFFETALQIDPQFYDSYYRLGQIAQFEGDKNLAKEYFEKALMYRQDFVEARKALDSL